MNSPRSADENHEIRIQPQTPPRAQRKDLEYGIRNKRLLSTTSAVRLLNCASRRPLTHQAIVLVVFVMLVLNNEEAAVGTVGWLIVNPCCHG
jgi:hypothetical protein